MTVILDIPVSTLNLFLNTLILRRDISSIDV